MQASNPSEIAYALQCDLPALKTATLLIVDQFEELFTSAPDAVVGPFVKLLLTLADAEKDVRVLLTVRTDYFNLLSDVRDAAGQPVVGAEGQTLFKRLHAEGGDAILRLKRISDEGLRDAVCKPLRLAGESNEGELQALLGAVQREFDVLPALEHQVVVMTVGEQMPPSLDIRSNEEERQARHAGVSQHALSCGVRAGLRKAQRGVERNSMALATIFKPGL